MTNAVIIEQEYATIATNLTTITTTRLIRGRYVRIDDVGQFPQLCVGASRRGPTIVYQTPEALALACRARLYKTRRGFDAAVARLQEGAQ